MAKLYDSLCELYELLQHSSTSSCTCLKHSRTILEELRSCSRWRVGTMSRPPVICDTGTGVIKARGFSWCFSYLWLIPLYRVRIHGVMCMYTILDIISYIIYIHGYKQHTHTYTHIHTYTHTHIHTLHYVTLHYIITLHYHTLHYIAVHYITIPYHTLYTLHT